MTRKHSRKKIGNRARNGWKLIHYLFVAVAVAAVLATAWLLMRGPIRADENFTTLPPAIDDALRAASQFPPEEALECSRCHKEQFEDWFHSQHAHANRLIEPVADFPAFKPGTKVRIGAHETRLYRDGDELLFRVQEPDGSDSLHRAEAVIGVDPLVQYLVTAPGGRLQAIDTGLDVKKNEFFNVFGEERFAHEWGYWRNRAMTWNVQCAFCHMTGLKRNYDAATDSYHTTWRAMGISCSQCHGHMPQHRANPSAPIVDSERLSVSQRLDNCASCHSRREELSTGFAPGDNYLDYFRPALVDTAEHYYADGQVRDENFEYGSFLMSRMFHKNVTCLDCHQPHSGKLRLPAENNAMCMFCHGGEGNRGATPISDPSAHSHHAAGSLGDRCIDCHMPVTYYMQRDPRRDHGFTIPDPLLTKELGIPNACNRCHKDKSTDWAIEWTERWYGEKLKRRSRDRARVVVRARAHDPTVVPHLLEMARTEEIGAWRASLVGLLDFVASQPEVAAFLRESASHPDPLVRAAAVRASAMAPEGSSIARGLINDPVRLVRLDAAWTMVARGGRVSPDLQAELQNYIETTSEQPQGAARAAQLALIENRTADAESWMRKAAAWDGSEAAQLMLAQTLHGIGKSAEAAEILREVINRDERNADARYMLALLLGESGKQGEVVKLLRKTVELDPNFDRAWYNLGLALAEVGDFAGSVEALSQAEKLSPSSPDPPYARATVLARMGRMNEAKEAAREALRRVPEYYPAKKLLKRLP